MAFPHLLDLAFDGCQDALLPGNVSLVLVLAWELLMLITWLDELLKHLVLLRGEAVLQVEVAFHGSGRRHRSGVVDAENDRLLLAEMQVLSLLGGLDQVGHVLGFRDLLWLDRDAVLLAAELAGPDLLVLLELEERSLELLLLLFLLLKLVLLEVLLPRNDLRVGVDDG